MPRYTKLLNPDEDPVDMHAVVPKDEANRSGGYVVRKVKQVGTGRMPRPPGTQLRQVRVKVKTHDKGNGAYRSSVAATLNYVSKEGRIFDRDRDLTESDKERFSEAWGGDRMIHHWMINPEDGRHLTFEQARTIIRETMASVERTIPKPERDNFRWLAGVEQRDDGSWHGHVAVRGVSAGMDLTFHPVFERHWIRSYAEEATTDQLGWRGARALEDERTHRDRDRGRDLTEERDDRERERTRLRDMTEERGRDDEEHRKRTRDTIMDGRER